MSANVHNNFKEEIAHFKSNPETKKIGVSFGIVKFLEGWLAHHIKPVDKAYATNVF
ncbi:MAG: hypothetical protein HC830_13995 [Bacteroidetes bacterium]|nr:hypothetical protein [Bacteroidota bacterium]